MKRATLLAMAAVAGCSSKPDATCPSIEALAHREAVADARAALAKGDRHLLMLGGFVGDIPGVPDPSAYPTQMIDGTSDTTTEACRRQRSTAEIYAAQYNEAITGTH